jgi:hypothetical protein
MTKINQHRPIPSGAPPVTHNSGNMRSTPAGGEVSRDQYANKAPQSPGAGDLNKGPKG